MNVRRFVSVCCSVLGLATAALAQRLPESEPNGTAATATMAPFGAQLDAMLTPGDHDWYSITVAATASVKLFISPLTATDVDTVLTLYDATGAVVLAENDDQRGLHSDLTLELPAGSYFARVRGFSTGTTGLYSLDVAQTAPIGVTGTEAVEPNNSVATATPIGCGGEVKADLTVGDADWYQVVVTAPRTGIVFAVLSETIPALGSFGWEIKDGAGMPLGSPTTLGPNNGNSKANGTPVRCCFPPGTYHFVVKHTSSTGSYRVECAVMPMDAGGAWVPEATGTTVGLAVGQVGQGVLGSTTEQDVWGPISVSVGYLMAQTRGDSGSPLGNSTLELLDKNAQPFVDGFGQPIPKVFSGNLLDGSLHARGTWRMDGIAGDIVFLRVSSGGGSTGGYRLEIGGCGPFSGPTWFDGMGKTNSIDNVTCLGSNGQRPTLTTDSIYEGPVLGSLFARHVELAPPNGPVVWMQGLSDTFSPGFGPLPLDLTMFGAAGCSLLVDPLALTALVADPTGFAEFLQATPSTLSLSGAVIFEQVATLDPAANALGIAFSNSLMQRLGRRSW